MKSTHRYGFIDAKISNFIHRKTATLGQSRKPIARTNSTFGIEYELTENRKRAM